MYLSLILRSFLVIFTCFWYVFPPFSMPMSPMFSSYSLSTVLLSMAQGLGVRRWRSASEMTFGTHFGIDFSTFSEIPENLNSLHKAYFWKDFPSENRSFLYPFFINFSTFAPERHSEGIFEIKNADLHWKGRFLVPLRISRGAKMDPWISIFAKNR